MPAGSQKTNILLFMVDQLTAFALNAYGGGVCKTPHLDRLAQNGVVFENAYCNYPLCAPSRFSMMSGRLPSRIGAYDNGAEFTASTPTFAHYLRLMDYHTCLSGKMHFVGPDQHHGFEERLTTEIYPADFSWTPVSEDENANQDDAHGRVAGVSTIDTVLDAGSMARTMQIDYDEDVIHLAIRKLFAHRRSSDHRPFFMTVSLTHPHDPYVTTQKYWALYDGVEIDPPRVAPIPVAERDPHSQSLYYHYGQDKSEISDADYLRVRRGYYGMISYVDDLFGRVMRALGDTGFAGNTTIIFTADHGDMMGERGMWFKKTLFEPAIRVPLIIAPPGCAPRRAATAVSLTSIFPTIVDLAGGDSGALSTPVDGRTLAPVLSGHGDTAHSPVLVEHIDGGTSAPRVMVRDADMKLVFSRDYPNQLYDLASDPNELNNLAGAGNPAEEKLTRIVEETWDLDALKKQVHRNQTARALIDRAMSKGRRITWEFAPPASSQNEKYVRHGDLFPDVERRGYLPYPANSATTGEPR